MKMFNVAVIMTIVATVTVANGATYSGLNDYLDEISTIQNRCPPNATADFDVIFNDEDSSAVEGCASLESSRSRYDSNEMKMFSVRFGRRNNGVCVSGNNANVDQLVFFCKSQSATPPLELDNGKVYRLNGNVIKPANKLQNRCVLYKMTNSVINMIAISGTTSCEGLSRLMFYSKATPPKGSILLRLSKPSNNIRYVRSTSEDKNSTKLEQDFTGSIYTWMMG